MPALPKYAYLAYEHWKKYRPKMFAELQESGRLYPVLEELNERVGDMMSDLIEKGLQHHEAWELARQEIYLPSEDDEPSLGETEPPFREPSSPPRKETTASPKPIPLKKGEKSPSSSEI